jgi:hypothetical protein
VQIANSEHYFEYRNSVIAEKNKRREEKEPINLLENIVFYLKNS